MLDRNDGDFSYSDLAHIGRYFKIRSRFFQWILATLLFHLFLFMHPVAINAEVQYKGMDLIDVNVLIESKVKDSEKFSGLASMYIVIGLFVAVGVTIKSFWYRIRGFLGIKNKSEKKK